MANGRRSARKARREKIRDVELIGILEVDETVVDIIRRKRLG